MSAVTHASVSLDGEPGNELTGTLTPATGMTQYSNIPNLNSLSDTTGGGLNWQFSGDYAGPKDSILPREFRQRLYKHFARIEHDFEREYRRLYGENLALQERLEKFEEGEHAEPAPLAKKLGASMLSQRIKQQYKQSTSRLVSSLRPSTGHSTTSGPLGSHVASHGATSTLSTSASTGPLASSTAGTMGTSAVCAPSTTSSNPQALTSGSFAGHGGTWQLMHRINAHRDGIWEVTAHRKFVATASADTTVRLWANDMQLNCLLVYLGHSGSVNSVRFRNWDHLLLTSSGEGTAHLIRLPYDHLVKAAAALAAGSSSSTAASAALEAATSTLVTEVAGSAGMPMAPTTTTQTATHLPMDADDGMFSVSTAEEVLEEGSPVRSTVPPNPIVPIHVRHPHAVFQSANLGFPGSSVAANGGSTIDSSPLAAAEFVTGREQIVTAGWDRLGRIYDLTTGQELNSLTGHDHQLTDVRCAHGGSPLVVTSSKDCTFRLWDFRQPGMRVHVQQAHTLTLSTTQFLPGGSNDRLISAGGDRMCRLWDLRQSRGPLVTIRTDAGINRLAISGNALTTSTFVGDSGSEASSATLTSAPPATAPGETLTPVTGVALPSITTLQSSNLFQASTQGPGLTASHVPATSCTWATGYRRFLALPLDNRMIKFFDLNGTRIGRLTRSSRGHTRMVTCVAWADEGFCNLFSTGFDSRLLTWQINFNTP